MVPFPQHAPRNARIGRLTDSLSWSSKLCRQARSASCSMAGAPPPPAAGPSRIARPRHPQAPPPPDPRRGAPGRNPKSPAGSLR